MINAITEGVQTLITLSGNVVTAIFGEAGVLAPLLPLIGLAVAGTVVFFGVKIIKSLSWGVN